jgi:hypothetical protein
MQFPNAVYISLEFRTVDEAHKPDDSEDSMQLLIKFHISLNKFT